MATCIICKTKYFLQSWSSPAEPCDCGSCVSQRDALEMSEDDRYHIAVKQAEWKQQQKEQR